MEPPRVDDAAGAAGDAATPTANAAGAAAGRAPRRTRILARAAVVVCAVLLAAVTGEVILRVLGKGDPPPEWPLLCAVSDVYESFEPHGYRLRPSRRTTGRYPSRSPRELTVVSNRDGFRSSREFGEPAPGRRVVVLGDSFAFGLGVEEAERFTDRVEAANPAWRIENLGTPAYGADLMLRSLEHVGLRSRPDAVLLCMFTNDFYRVEPSYAGLGFPIPRYRLEDGALVSVAYPIPTVWDRLRLVNVVRRQLWRSSRMEWRLNEAILDRFVALGETHRFAPAIVFIPAQFDRPRDQERREWLAQYAARHRVAFVDLTDPILAAGDAAFIPGDVHLNAAGHAIVAGALTPFIASVLDARR